MSDEWEIIHCRWRNCEPVEGVAFLANDRVEIDPDSSDRDVGHVVNLRAVDPVPTYEVVRESGERINRCESQLNSPVPARTLEHLAWIQKWYAAQCDGDWEHSHGILIETLDNPGWAIKIDLVETDLDSVAFAPIERHESARTWIVCRVTDGQWQGFGGPHMLAEILQTFVGWARQHQV
jgi:hypothetical protein